MVYNRELAYFYAGQRRGAAADAPARVPAQLDRTGGSGHDIARTFTAASAPGLAGLVGQPVAGSWTLLVSDHEAVDIGKLNRWSLVIRRA